MQGFVQSTAIKIINSLNNLRLAIQHEGCVTNDLFVDYLVARPPHRYRLYRDPLLPAHLIASTTTNTVTLHNKQFAIKGTS